MSISGDYRERHGHKKSGFRVVFYLVLLVLTILLILKAGDLSRGFTEVFLKGAPVPQEPN
jgi:competence protein ComGC